MKATIELRQPRNFGEIISDCIVFLKQNWKSLLKTYFVFCGFFVAGIMLFSLLMKMKLISQHNAAMAGNYSSTYTVFGLEYFLVLLFVFLNVVSAILCVLSYIALYAQNGGKVPTVNDVWVYYKYYFWRAIGHSLLLFVIFFIGLIILVLPLSLIFSGITSPYVGLVAGFGILIPIFYFMTVFSIYFPIVIVENGGFGYAFGKSFKLIKGRWWNTFGVVFVIGIIVYALFFLITVPFSYLSGGTITFISYNVSFPIVLLYTIMISLWQMINILPLTASAITYFSLAEEKENIGLLERIETLGVISENIEANNEAY